MLVKYLQRHLARYDHQRLLIGASISLLQRSYNAATRSSATKNPIANKSVITDAWTTSKAGQFPSITDLWKILKSKTDFPELARDMPQVWTCKFNRTWIIKQLLQYKWSNKVTYGELRLSHGALRSWMIPGLACEHSSPWRVPVEKQQQWYRIIYNFK